MRKKQSIPKQQGRKPKYDYSSKEFLDRIGEYAKRGFTDGEIALSLGINQTYFSELKGMHPEIPETLTRMRAQVNGLVRAAFLKTALGGRLVRTTQYVQKRCECKGNDPKCEICDGTGWITPTQHRCITETELAPNLMAQQRWLMNYDSDWKKKSSGEDDESVVTGIDIQVVYNDKKDLDLQEKKQNDTEDETGD